jgi:hypothetical protein
MRAVNARDGMFLVAIALCSGQVSCAQACTADFRYGLSVSVVDRLTGAPICDATVTATDGGHSETLTMLPRDPLADAGIQCLYLGAGERAGTYAIDARAGGRQSSTTGIELTRDACHVVGRAVRLEL